MDNVQARPAMRRLAIFFIGIVVAVGLLAAVGNLSAAEPGVRAGGSGESVSVLAGPPSTKHWAPKPPTRGGGCGTCK